MSRRSRGLVAVGLTLFFGGWVLCTPIGGEPTFSPNTPNQLTFDTVSARCVRFVVPRWIYTAV